MDELQGKNVEFFSMENMQKNEKATDFIYTSMCVIAGCMAGIIGLTGLAGFAFLACAYVVTAVATWVFKLRMDVKVYFNTNTLSFIFSGVFSQALSFILFWTLSYGLVHIY
uniref:ER membrane protein complex subunit 6 n=1 Tax=Globisporangium ultimum (strain ATCC 200006 / CBS 805.95 / DAOM BR144) TaxID=431595 RepID=K3X3M8_GLOUD